MDSTIRLLKQLVAIDSVNPSLVSGAKGERRLPRPLWTSFATSVSTPAFRRPRRDQRRWRARRTDARERSLMFCGHTDTVGVAGMTRPFDAAERAGRVYGRGSQDMKGGVAAMIGASAGDCRIRRSCRRSSHHRVRCGRRARKPRRPTLVTNWRADAAVSPSQPNWRSRWRTRFSGSRSKRRAAPPMAAARATDGTRFCEWAAC